MISELCCMMCNTAGKHKGHNFLSLEGSKDFTTKTLRASIETIEIEAPTLRDILRGLEEDTDEYQAKIDEAMGQAKQRFSEIREALDRKEREVLEKIEGAQTEKERLAQLTTETQDILNDYQTTLETGISILYELESASITTDIAYRAVCITKKVKEIQRIKESYNSLHGYKTVVDTKDFEDETQKAMQLVNTINEIKIRGVPLACPKGLRVKDVGPFLVALEWDKDEEYDDGKYAISYQLETDTEGPKETMECTRNRTTIGILESSTAYKFSVAAKRNGVISEWSDALAVKTEPATVENMVAELKVHHDNARLCTKALEQLKILGRDGNYHSLPPLSFKLY